MIKVLLLIVLNMILTTSLSHKKDVCTNTTCLSGQTCCNIPSGPTCAYGINACCCPDMQHDCLWQYGKPTRCVCENCPGPKCLCFGCTEDPNRGECTNNITLNY